MLGDLSTKSCANLGEHAFAEAVLRTNRRPILSGTFALAAAALITEAAAGYPQALFQTVGHPVTWMGSLLSALDRRLNLGSDSANKRTALGVVSLFALLASTTTAALAVSAFAGALLPDAVAFVLLAAVASSCLAQRSLDAHVQAVADALEHHGVDEGRKAVGRIVGRDTRVLDQSGICRAAIESLAENFADGVVAPAFWLVLLGLPGAFVYKAVNTADSMIGHRTTRHEDFGYGAAKLDDIANFVPARLAALLLAMAASFLSTASAQSAWRVMRRDARGHPSPNAGWPEAAMAGALGVRLGGPRTYANRKVPDAFIGDPCNKVDSTTIRAALRVYRAACALQIGTITLLALVIALWR